MEGKESRTPNKDWVLKIGVAKKLKEFYDNVCMYCICKKEIKSGMTALGDVRKSTYCANLHSQKGRKKFMN